MSFLARNVFPDVDGVTDLFSISFPYLNESDVHVYVNEERQINWSFQTESTVKFDTPPTGGSDVLILRATQLVSRETDYANLAELTEQNLDDDSLQAFYALQELHDGILSGSLSDAIGGGAGDSPLRNGHLQAESLTYLAPGDEALQDVIGSAVPLWGTTVLHYRSNDPNKPVAFLFEGDARNGGRVAILQDGNISISGTPKQNDHVATVEYVKNYVASNGGGSGGGEGGGSSNSFSSLILENAGDGDDIKMQVAEIYGLPTLSITPADGSGTIGMILATNTIAGEEAYVGFLPDGRVFGSAPEAPNDFVTLKHMQDYVESEVSAAFAEVEEWIISSDLVPAGARTWRLPHARFPEQRGDLYFNFSSVLDEEVDYLIINSANKEGRKENLGLMINYEYSDDGTYIGKIAGMTPYGQWYGCDPTDRPHSVTLAYFEDNLAEDAPEGGDVYGRKAGEWVKIVANIPASDGKAKVLLDGSWVDMPALEDSFGLNPTFDSYIINGVDGNVTTSVVSVGAKSVLTAEPVADDVPTLYVWKSLTGTTQHYMAFDEAGNLTVTGSPTADEHVVPKAFADVTYMPRSAVPDTGQYMYNGVWMNIDTLGYLTSSEVDTRIADAVTGGTISSYEWDEVVVTGDQKYSIRSIAYAGDSAVLIAPQDVTKTGVVVFGNETAKGGFRSGRGFSSQAPRNGDEYVRMADADSRYPTKTATEDPTQPAAPVNKRYVDGHFGVPVAAAVVRLTDATTAAITTGVGVDSVSAAAGVVALDLTHVADAETDLLISCNAVVASTGAPLLVGFDVTGLDTINMWAVDHAGLAVTADVDLHITVRDIGADSYGL